LVPKRVVMSGSWTKLRNAELHHWFCLPHIIRTLNSRGIRWAGLVTHTWGKKRYVYKVFVRKPEGKRPPRRPRNRWGDNRLYTKEWCGFKSK